MQYLTCPRCHSSFHTGAIYEALEVCPRCGAPFQPPRPSLWEHLREGVGPRVRGDAPDWEAITGSQYTRHLVTRTNPAGGLDGSHGPSAPVASPRDRSANRATRVAEQFPSRRIIPASRGHGHRPRRHQQRRHGRQQHGRRRQQREHGRRRHGGQQHRQRRHQRAGRRRRWHCRCYQA